MKNINKKKGHPEVSLLRISHFLHKIKENTLLIKTRKRETLKQVQGGLSFIPTKAFTLIELLVVVLIIGILAAIAVPQYQKAVIKSSYATLKPLVESIAQAQEVYYLANGTYTTDLETLGASLPTPTSASYGKFYYPWGVCWVELSNIACRHEQRGIGYEKYYQHSNMGNVRSCLAAEDNTASNQICKQEVGHSSVYGKGKYGASSVTLNVYHYE